MERSTRVFVLSIAAVALLISTLIGGVVGGSATYWWLQRSRPAVAASAAPALASPAISSPAAARTAGDTVSAVRAVAPAVVTVVNELAQQVVQTPFGPMTTDQAGKATGSGVIIDRAGYVITNNHVVEGAQTLSVVYADGSTHAARLIGRDSYADLAVIKVDDAVPAAAQLGDSDALQQGEPVVAIGSPLGEFQNTVTAGVVSGLHRAVDQMENLIQTDAAINHGNSGGPLINLAGQVIGINTLVVRGNTGDAAEGLGFAIPASTVRDVTTQLIESGKVDRPYLGVDHIMLTADIAQQLGLQPTSGELLRRVYADSPAAAAGLQRGDIVTAIDGAALNRETTLTAVLMRHKAGDRLRLTVLRQGQTLKLEATLALRTPDGQ